MLQTAAKGPEDRLVAYLKAAHVQWDQVVLADLPEMWASERDIRRYMVEPGDLLVCEGGDVGRAALLEGPSQGPLIIQNSVHRIRSHGGDLGYLRHVLEAIHGSGWLDVVCNKATIGHLTEEKLAALSIPDPTVEVQQRIALWLDRELESLQSVVARQQRLLDLVIEREIAAINEQLTARFNGSATPQAPLRRVAKFIDYRGSTPQKTASGVPLLTARNLKRGTIDWSLSAEFIAESDYDVWMRRGLPIEGDVLVTTEAPLGEVARLGPEKVALAQRIILLRADQSRLRPGFLYWYLRSAIGQAELKRRATGSTALGIKADRLKEVPVPLPPVDIQLAVERELDHAASKAARLRRAVESQLERLTERRRTLIATTVAAGVSAGDAVMEAA